MKLNTSMPPILILVAAMGVTACSPRVEVALPSEPITINLNVKIKHEILVKVDKEIDTLLNEQSDIF